MKASQNLLRSDCGSEGVEHRVATALLSQSIFSVPIPWLRKLSAQLTRALDFDRPTKHIAIH